MREKRERFFFLRFLFPTCTYFPTPPTPPPHPPENNINNIKTNTDHEPGKGWFFCVCFSFEIGASWKEKKNSLFFLFLFSLTPHSSLPPSLSPSLLLPPSHYDSPCR